MAKIESLGGAVAAIEQGFLQREIEEAAYASQKEIENGSRVVVGVNALREEGAPPPILTVDPAIEQDQIARLRAFPRVPRRGGRRGGPRLAAARRRRGPQPPCPG
jgi:methylmalonyl-CoA mutase N-terminal domain/subunit